MPHITARPFAAYRPGLISDKAHTLFTFTLCLSALCLLSCTPVLAGTYTVT